MRLRPYSPTDPTRIIARADFAAEHEAAGRPLFGPEPMPGVAWTLTETPATWSLPLACGGLEPQGHGRWAGWLYAADLSPRGWAMVRRAFRAMIAETEARRVELNVRTPLGAAEWPLALAACAFAEKLGLSREGLMRGWGPDGRDYWLYAGIF